MTDPSDRHHLPEPSADEVHLVARGIATAVAPVGGLTDNQCGLLQAITLALTGQLVEYRGLDPLDPEELAVALAERPVEYRRRIVHHMVLGELILVPLPEAVAVRVAEYAAALGVDDDFIRIARRYAQGALGLAWVDLRRSGFTDRWTEERMAPLYTSNTMEDPFDAPSLDPDLAARWHAFAGLPDGTLGREVWRMYEMRAWDAPGSDLGASAFIAQHDFVHVISDYGTHMEGEMEVFAFIGRADPDPMGFSWLATMVGLFETGYVHEQGFFRSNVREHTLQMGGMAHRLADAIRRGKAVQERYDTDLFAVDYHALATAPLDAVRAMLGVPPKGEEAVAAGSPGIFDLDGMSEAQKEWAATHGDD
ncbi:MAG: hypothetical protein FJW95_15765 [Actinobacteria bacterium]|nr:hypothetical protein [Actinomycetota bacterium]